MTATNRLDCQIIAHRYGLEHQGRIAQEECAELIQAISKVFRNPLDTGFTEHLSEEMADVEIMLEQLKELVGNGDRVQWYTDYKIKRTLGGKDGEVDNLG